LRFHDFETISCRICFSDPSSLLSVLQLSGSFYGTSRKSDVSQNMIARSERTSQTFWCNQPSIETGWHSRTTGCCDGFSLNFSISLKYTRSMAKMGHAFKKNKKKKKMRFLTCLQTTFFCRLKTSSIMTLSCSVSSRVRFLDRCFCKMICLPKLSLKSH
jgi:hypothetical protein